MAIARCHICSKPRANKPPEYSDLPYEPAGYPDSGVVCGTKGCENSAFIWLKADEVRLYDTGKRVFDLRQTRLKSG
jgi:hypothetical protein